MYQALLQTTPPDVNRSHTRQDDRHEAPRDDAPAQRRDPPPFRVQLTTSHGWGP